LYAQRNKCRKGYLVFVYKNNVELTESPFSSYGLATKALDIDSNIIRRYIDWGKIYNNMYAFYSYRK